MPQPRRPQLPRRVRGHEIPWPELRRQASAVFLMLQAGWGALDERERSRVSELVRKSRGRPRNLTKTEARELGGMAGRAASAAQRARKR
ncbi:MAG TPA: hypothetical protein VH276_10730 [Solirubrobacteraceae bacterium]|nr:hypothetical protein [Solirubrobacteraceae bacterium]